jgi:hypothetical protein
VYKGEAAMGVSASTTEVNANTAPVNNMQHPLPLISLEKSSFFSFKVSVLLNNVHYLFTTVNKDSPVSSKASNTLFCRA